MNLPCCVGTPFIIFAPSGTGKTSICREISSIILGLAFSVSYTTRPKRKEEREGEDYFFISFEKFKEMIKKGRFLKWAQVHEYYYGTSKDFVTKKITQGLDCLLDIDAYAAKRLKKIYPNDVFIFVIPPSLQKLSRRLSRRRTEYRMGKKSG